MGQGMHLGFNSNLQLGSVVYQVQTEDRGSDHPFIDTVVLFQGQVLHRRSTSYGDLLAGGAADQAVLQARVEQQHRAILDALRAGSLPLEQLAPRRGAGGLEIRLRNPSSWLAAGQVSLELEVRSRADGQPAAETEIEARVEGIAENAQPVAARSDAQGFAALRFALPQIADGEPAVLVVHARSGGAEEQLRFRIKAKASAGANAPDAKPPAETPTEP